MSQCDILKPLILLAVDHKYFCFFILFYFNQTLMPELPQTVVIRRKLAQKIITKKIASFRVLSLKILRGPQRFFNKKIVNSSFKSIQAHGRTLIFKLNSGYYLFACLQSSAQFVYHPAEELPAKYTRAIFEFKDGSQLFFNDNRSHGYFKLLNDKQRKRALVHFGADPLAKSFSFLAFRQILKNKRTNLKNFLTTQTYISGLGNIYADEICFEARLKPDRGVKTLKDSEKKRLYRAIRKILIRAIKHNNPIFKVYDRQGMKCLRCRQGIIRKQKILYKWMYYCPLCQN